MPTQKNTDSGISTYLPFRQRENKLSADKSIFPAVRTRPKSPKIIMPRALKKSLTFRVFATLGTFAVTYAFTGNVVTGMGISTAQALTNTTIYYWHERMWTKEPKKGNAE